MTFLNLRNSKVLVFPRVECSNLKTFRRKRLHFEEKHISGLDTYSMEEQPEFIKYSAKIKSNFLMCNNDVNKRKINKKLLS